MSERIETHLAETMAETIAEELSLGGDALSVARAVLSTFKDDRIAVVELADEDADGNWFVPSCGSFNGMESTGDSVISVEITDDGIEAETFGGMTPEEARLLAGALLAAAVEAER